MIPDDLTRQKLIRETAQRDLLDIEALAKNTEFNRFWVPKLDALYRFEVESSLTSMTVELREAARYRALALRELTKMPARERESCERLLKTELPSAPRPTQVG